MFAFRRLVDRRIVEKDQFHEKMAGVPSIIVDSLLARFTEVSRGSTTYVFQHRRRSDIVLIAPLSIVPQSSVHDCDTDQTPYPYTGPMSQTRRLCIRPGPSGHRPQYGYHQVGIMSVERCVGRC